MSNGARCGPRSYCVNHRCVPVPEVSHYCKHCEGVNIGCNQTGRCMCDKENDCSTGGRPTPPPGAIIDDTMIEGPISVLYATLQKENVCWNLNAAILLMKNSLYLNSAYDIFNNSQ